MNPIIPAQNARFSACIKVVTMLVCGLAFGAASLFATPLDTEPADLLNPGPADLLNGVAEDSLNVEPADTMNTRTVDMLNGKPESDVDTGDLSDRNMRLTQDAIFLYGDRSIDEALTRFTGVHLLPDTGPVVRGLGPMAGGLYNVSVNGQRLASTGFETRRVDLGRLPVDMFQYFSLMNSAGVERSGDAIAGSIHLGLKEPETDQLRLNASYSRGVHSSYTDILHPENQATLSVSSRYGENVAFTAGMYVLNMHRASERLQIEHGAFDFEGDLRDVTESLSPQFGTVSDLTRGAFFNVNIDGGERADFFASGFANISDQGISRHTQRYLPNEDWASPDETGLVGNRGVLEYQLDVDESALTKAMLTTGGNYHRDNWQVSYQGGWSYGGRNEETISIPFQAAGLNFVSERANPARPELSISNRDISNQDLRIQPMRNVMIRQDEHVLSARTDVSFFFSPGVISAGVSFNNTSKKGNYRDSGMRLLALSSAANFRQMSIDNFRLMQTDAYTFQTLVSPSDARSFFTNNYSLFRKDLRNQILVSDPRKYEAMEQVYGGYLKTEMNAGAFDITVGARLEYTDGKYTGNQVLFNDIGNHVVTSDTTVANRYLHILPDLLIGYQVGTGIRVVASWSQSLARQDYRYLTPFRLVQLQNQTLQAGNAELAPLEADHFDFKIRYANDSGSRLHLGAFHKIIRGLIRTNEEEVVFNDDITLEGSFFERTDEALLVSGFEVALRQYLVFLPGIGRNLGVAGGYAYTVSDYSPVFRSGSYPFPGMSPHVLNAALFYDTSRLSAQLSFFHAASYTSVIASEERFLPSLGGLVHADRNRSGYSNLNAVVRLGLSSGVDIWVQALGILTQEQTEYTGSGNLYPWLVDAGDASLYHAGLRIRL
ncbi:MAG: TonB-dependent receptor [Balneolaceae bacterium]|nr:MAG: TonB-dependent receptor [Balneolaceae bacterium]